MNPPDNETINGVPDAYSQPFFDDFGPNSSAVTNFTAPPFPGSNIVFVANSICASTCSIFSSYLYQKHGVRSAVFGGLPTEKTADSQFDAGVKGSEVTSYGNVLYELQLAGLQNDPQAPQPLPIEASLTMNFRNALPYIDQGMYNTLRPGRRQIHHGTLFAQIKHVRQINHDTPLVYNSTFLVHVMHVMQSCHGTLHAHPKLSTNK